MISSIVSVSLMFFEILAAEIVFAPFMHRRKNFFVRMTVCVLTGIEIIVLISLLYASVTDGIFVYGSNSEEIGDSVFKFLYYLSVFAFTVGCMLVCYRDSAWIVLFYCSGGYALQHLCFNISSMVRHAAGLTDSAVATWVVELTVCAFAFLLARLTLVALRADATEARGVKGKTLICLAVLFVCIGLSRITIDDFNRTELAFWAESLYAVISCVLILGILFSITQRDKAQSEAETMEEILRREKEQYELSKENIDIINIKCHDLKHQISLLRANASEEYIKEIEDAVMIYGATVKTGNDILDIILTEKSLLCEKNGITLTCVMDGSELSFMNKADIYSLFGNALANAIESARSVADGEKRCISIASQRVGDFFSVHMENFYEGEIEFQDGLPMTRGDKTRHGFGMRSMKHIAEKYGGYMTVTADGGRFRLDFLFPVAEKK